MRRSTAVALLVPYLIFLFGVTLAWRPERSQAPEQRLQLVPLETTRFFVREMLWWSRRPGPETYWNIARGFGVNVLGNLAVFVPLGFLLPALCARKTTAWHALAAGALLSTLIETLQYVSGRRIADVDDVMLNTLGALIGFACWAGWNRARIEENPTTKTQRTQRQPQRRE